MLYGLPSLCRAGSWRSWRAGERDYAAVAGAVRLFSVRFTTVRAKEDLYCGLLAFSSATAARRDGPHS